MTERHEQPKKGGHGRPGAPAGTGRRAAKPVRKGMGMALLPGLRERLFKEMDGAKIPKEGRLQYLCSMTGRKPQTARRWIETERPGLPDLESFATICGAFDTDANWMLGLIKARYPLDGAVMRLPNFTSLLQDIAVLQSLNIQVVLVFGARQQVRELAAARKVKLSSDDGMSLTDAATLEVSADAISRLTSELIGDLSALELRVAVPEGWVPRAFFALADNHGVVLRGFQRDDEELEELFHRIIGGTKPTNDK